MSTKRHTQNSVVKAYKKSKLKMALAILLVLAMVSVFTLPVFGDASPDNLDYSEMQTEDTSDLVQQPGSDSEEDVGQTEEEQQEKPLVDPELSEDETTQSEPADQSKAPLADEVLETGLGSGTELVPKPESEADHHKNVDQQQEQKAYFGGHISLTDKPNRQTSTQLVNNVEVILECFDPQGWIEQQRVLTREIDGVPGSFMFEVLAAAEYRVVLEMEQSIDITVERVSVKVDHLEENKVDLATEQPEPHIFSQQDTQVTIFPVYLDQGDAAYAVFYLSAAEEKQDYQIDIGTLKEGDSGVGWFYSNRVLHFDQQASSPKEQPIWYTLTGQSDRIGIAVDDQVQLYINLNNASLTSIAADAKAAFSIGADSQVTMRLEDGSSNKISIQNSLSGAGIYVAQSSVFVLQGDTGRLTVDMPTNAKGAAIGATADQPAGSIVIDGGQLFVRSGSHGAGIGGGSTADATVESISIYGGTLKIKPNTKDYYLSNKSAGIGAGKAGSVLGDIVIDGGEINTEGYSGIGGSVNGAVRGILIHDGKITSTSTFGPAIGAAMQGDGTERIVITGGEVNASVSRSIGQSSGIGVGGTGRIDEIRISGGSVKSLGRSNNGGAGIGTAGESQSWVGKIVISGGTVEAKGLEYQNVGGGIYSDITSGPGIGAGGHGQVDSIHISGGNIYAEAGLYGAAGIGGGYYEDSFVGSIVVDGGNITTIGGRTMSVVYEDISRLSKGGAGIGNGSANNVGQLLLNNGKVTAFTRSNDHKAIDAANGNQGKAYLFNGRFAKNLADSSLLRTRLQVYNAATGSLIVDTPYPDQMDHPYLGYGVLVGQANVPTYAVVYNNFNKVPKYSLVLDNQEKSLELPSGKGKEELLNRSYSPFIAPPRAEQITSRSANITTDYLYTHQVKINSAQFILSNSPDMKTNPRIYDWTDFPINRPYSHYVDGLQSNTRYYIQTKAESYNWSKTVYSPVKDQGPFFVTPPLITSFRADNIDTDWISLSGKIAESENGNPITGAELWYSTSLSELQNNPQVITLQPHGQTNGGTAGYSDTDFNVVLEDLKPSTDYYFRIVVKNSDDQQTYGGSDVGDLMVTTKAGYKSLPIQVTSAPANTGTASANFVKAKPGQLVHLTASPAKGYHLKKWVVLNGGPLTIQKDGSFIMPKSEVSIQAEFEPNTKLLNITIPTRILFSSNQANKGSIKSPEYQLTNHSVLGVEVSLEQFKVTHDAGIKLLEGRTAPDPSGQNGLWLGLVTGGRDNSVPVKLNGITPETVPDNQLLGRLEAGNQQPKSMTIQIFGRYYGPYENQIKPKYGMILHFKPTD